MKPLKKAKPTEKEFFQKWTQEELINECVRLNCVLEDCLKILKKIGR